MRKVPGGVANREVAQQYENDLKLKILKGEIGIAGTDPDLSSLIKEYLAFSKTNKAPASYSRDEIALRNFVTITGYKKLSDLTPRSIEKYKQTRLEKMSKRTVNLEITMLQAMLNKMIQLGVIPENPIKAVKKIRGPESKTLEFLTRNEIDVLLPTLSPAYYPVIYTFLKTGLRKNELVYLEWEDIDFDKLLIRVVNKKAHPTKSYKPRYIPMDKKLGELLNSIKRTKSSYVFVTGRETLRKNNLITNLKRTAKKAGVDLPTVKALLGHADIHTTMRYAHLAPDHLRQAAEKLSF